MTEVNICPECRDALRGALDRDAVVYLGDGILLRRTRGLEGTVLHQDNDIFSTGEEWEADRDEPD